MEFNVDAVNPKRISQFRTKNLTSIYVGFGGIYPLEFFTGDKKNGIGNSFLGENKNNIFLLEHIVSLIHNMQFNIYYKDVSALGFPAVQIIIPGLSEINIMDDFDHLERTYKYEKVCKILQNMDCILLDDCHFLIDFLKTTEEDVSLFDFVKAPLSDNSVLISIDKDMLLCMLYIKIKSYDNAKLNLDNYLLKVKADKSISENMVNYYSQLSLILKYYNLYDKSKITEFISAFAKTLYVEELFGVIEGNEIFEEFPSFDCTNCKLCQFENQCFSLKEEKIMEYIMEKKIKGSI